MQCLVLPYELFDSGDAHCRNFWLADDEDAYFVSFSYIQRKFPHIVPDVLTAIAQGKRFLDIYKQTKGLYREVQWD